MKDIFFPLHLFYGEVSEDYITYCISSTFFINVSFGELRNRIRNLTLSTRTVLISG